MRRSQRLIAGVLVSSALALAGCGGDDGPSREEYAQQLDEICSDLEEASEEQLERGDPDSPREAARLLRRFRPQIERAVERLKELERPDGDAGETADEYIATVERQYEEDIAPVYDDLEEALREGDDVAAQAALTRLESVDEEETERLEEELGAEECAEG